MCRIGTLVIRRATPFRHAVSVRAVGFLPPCRLYPTPMILFSYDPRAIKCEFGSYSITDNLKNCIGILIDVKTHSEICVRSYGGLE